MIKYQRKRREKEKHDIERDRGTAGKGGVQRKRYLN